jgi:hypothetical protein
MSACIGRVTVRYEEWEIGVPSQIRNERMWKFFGYRKALFLYDVCWKDCETLLKHPLGKADLPICLIWRFLWRILWLNPITWL